MTAGKRSEGAQTGAAGENILDGILGLYYNKCYPEPLSYAYTLAVN